MEEKILREFQEIMFHFRVSCKSAEQLLQSLEVLFYDQGTMDGYLEKQKRNYHKIVKELDLELAHEKFLLFLPVSIQAYFISFYLQGYGEKINGKQPKLNHRGRSCQNYQK